MELKTEHYAHHSEEICPYTHKIHTFCDNSPCMNGNTLHMTTPNMKSRSNAPTSVNGMHSTPSRMSDTAKFSRNTFVMVRIRLCCTSVMMTRILPTMASNRIVAYNGIWMRPNEYQDADAAAVDVVVDVATDNVAFDAIAVSTVAFSDVSCAVSAVIVVVANANIGRSVVCRWLCCGWSQATCDSGGGCSDECVNAVAATSLAI